MRPYSEDLRKRIIEARERGESARDIAQRYRVCKRSVERYWRRYQSSGSYAGYKKGNKGGSVLDKHKGLLLKWIEQKPGITLAALRQRIADERAITISVPGLWYRLRQYGLSYKKNAMGKRTKAR